MVNGLLRVTFGVIYCAKNAVAIADDKLFVLLQEKIDRVRRGFFCGVELFVVVQRPSEIDQTPRLTRRIAQSLKDL